MATDIGVRIGVEGESEFRNALKNINQQSRELASEMKALSAQFKNSASSEEAVTKKTELLNRQVENADKKVKLLSDKYEQQNAHLEELASALEEARTSYGENSDEAARAQAEYDNFAITVSKTKTQLNTAEQEYYNAAAALEEIQEPAGDASDELENVGDSAEDAGEKSSMFADVLKADLLADFIVSGIKGLADAFANIAKSIFSAFQGSVSWADELNTLSTNTGVSTDKLQAFQYMAGLTDTSVETITGSLRRLTMNMSGAKDGTGKAADAFGTLGVEFKNADGTLRNTYDVFIDTIDALGSFADGADRDALAMDLFGRGAQELNSLIKTGKEGIEAYTAEAEAMGYILSNDAINALVNVSDAEDRINNSLDSIKRNGAAAFAPFVADIAENVMPAISDLTNSIAEVFSGDKTFADFVAELNTSIEDNKDGIAGAASGFASGFADALRNAPDLVRSATEIITSITEEFKNADTAGDLASALGDAISAVAEMIGTISGPITELAVAFATQFAYAVGSHLPQILLSALKGVFGAGAGVLDGILGDGSNIFIDPSVMEEAGNDAVFKYAAGIEDGSWYVADASQNVADDTAEPLEEVAESGAEWGDELTTGLADSLRAGAEKVRAAAEEVAAAAAGPLHFSRPDYGPLRDYETWMPDMVKGLSASLNAALPMMDSAVTGLAGDIAYGLQGGLGANVVNITVTQPTEAWTEYIFDKFNVRFGGTV